MKIHVADDGTFAFLFGEHEKEMGVQLLLCIKPNNDEMKKAIQEAIRNITHEGADAPILH